MILSFIKDKIAVFLYFILYNSRFSPHIDSLNIRLSLNRQYSKLEATPPSPSLFSRVYIKTKKIPYSYIYNVYLPPKGGHYVSFVYYHFTKRQHTLNLHTKPNETQRPSTETNYSQISPTKPKEAQLDPFAMLYLCIVIHGKCVQSRTHPEGEANQTTKLI